MTTRLLERTRPAAGPGHGERTSRRLFTTAGVVSLAATLVGCGLPGGNDGDRPATPTNRSTSSTPTKAATGKDAFGHPVAKKLVQMGSIKATAEVSVYVYGIYRYKSYAVLLYGARITGGSAKDARLDEYTERSADIHDPHRLVANGTSLIDADAKKAYLPAWDATTGGECLCPVFQNVFRHQTSVGSVVYKAPPTSTSTMDVWLGRGVGYVTDIPVSEGRLPSLPTAEPGDKQAALVRWEPDSTKRPQRTEVLDIDTPTSNEDMSITRRRGQLTLAADVLFEFDKATLTAKGKKRVAEAAGILREEAHGPVNVNGFTDGKGSNSYNLALSKRRAATVLRTLKPKLTGTDIQLHGRGYGEAHPVARNSVDGKDKPKGRQLNRRVEIGYKK